MPIVFSKSSLFFPLVFPTANDSSVASHDYGLPTFSLTKASAHDVRGFVLFSILSVAPSAIVPFGFLCLRKDEKGSLMLQARPCDMGGCFSSVYKIRGSSNLRRWLYRLFPPYRSIPITTAVFSFFSPLGRGHPAPVGDVMLHR